MHWSVWERIAVALEKQVALMEVSRMQDAQTLDVLEALKRDQAAHIEACEQLLMLQARTGRVL